MVLGGRAVSYERGAHIRVIPRNALLPTPLHSAPIHPKTDSKTLICGHEVSEWR